MNVTIIKTQKRPNGMVKVSLDEGSSFTVSSSVAAEANLHEGQVLSPHEIASIRDAELLHRSLHSALRYLGPRPRSEMEIRLRLRRQGFAPTTIETTIAKLKEQGLLDDVAFAMYWRENRGNFKPLSSRRIGFELKQKGVSIEAISEVTAEIDDEPSAYRAAQRKARSLSGVDYHTFRKRLAMFLKQRGFDYDLINRTIDRVWQEVGTTKPD